MQSAHKDRDELMTRKLGKTHQNVLVFYKGNPQKIKEDFTEIEVEDFTGKKAERIG